MGKFAHLVYNRRQKYTRERIGNTEDLHKVLNCYNKIFKKSE